MSTILISLVPLNLTETNILCIKLTFFWVSFQHNITSYKSLKVRHDLQQFT